LVRTRVRILMLILTLPLVAIVARLAMLQLDPEAHFAFAGRAVHPSMRFDPPRRGAILDRSGRVIVENIPVFDLEFEYRRLNPRARFLEVICRELGRGGSFPSPLEVEDHLRSRVDLGRLLREEARRAASHVPMGDAREKEGWELLIEGISSRAARRIDAAVGGSPAFRDLFRLKRPPASDTERDDDEGTWNLEFAPSRAFVMERTLQRLAVRLEGVDFAALDARVRDRLAKIDRQAERDAERQRGRGADESTARQVARNSRIILFGNAWPLVSDVSVDAVTDIEYWPELFPGISVRDTARRHYPLGAAAGALLGSERELSKPDVERLKSEGLFLNRYRSIRSAEAFDVVRDGAMRHRDRIGASGLEKFYDARLRGRYGMRVVQIDKFGRPRSMLTSLAVEHGQNLHTTLDAELQLFLYELLAAKCNPRDPKEDGPVSGSIVVMEVPSGALLASVGFPSFDPNRLRESGYLGELDRGWGRQTTGWLLDRPQCFALYPGSIFKIVTAAAALESGREWEGAVDPLRTYRCTHVYELSPESHPIRCNSKFGHDQIYDMDLLDALKHSCNTYFYHLANRHLEPAMLSHWARNFGFGERTGVDLPIHRAYRDGRRAPEKDLDRGRLSKGQKVRGVIGSCHFAIGQVHVMATPMQVACAVGAIAVDGAFLPTPYLVDPPEPRPLRFGKEYTVQAIRKGLREVVQGGTAGELEAYNIAAKTATAQFASRDVDDRDHAWLVGFGPLPDPTTVFVIVLEKSTKGGGESCWRLAKELLDRLAARDPRFLRTRDEGGEP